MPDNELNQSKIKSLLTDFYNNPNLCGFDTFIVMKTDPRLKRMSMSENKNSDGDTFRDVLKNMIFSVISEYYLSDEAEYVDGTRLADNQNKFLIIKQSGNYNPFGFLANSETDDVFDIEGLPNATGIAFKLRKGDVTIWCYHKAYHYVLRRRIFVLNGK